MKSIKLMRLGIGLILTGIFFRIPGIGYLYSRFPVHYLPIVSVIVGSGFMVLGFIHDSKIE